MTDQSAPLQRTPLRDVGALRAELERCAAPSALLQRLAEAADALLSGSMIALV